MADEMKFSGVHASPCPSKDAITDQVLNVYEPSDEIEGIKDARGSTCLVFRNRSASSNAPSLTSRMRALVSLLVHNWMAFPYLLD